MLLSSKLKSAKVDQKILSTEMMKHVTASSFHKLIKTTFSTK